MTLSGQPSRSVLIDGEQVWLTHTEYNIFMVLWNAHGRWLSTRELFEMAYESRIDGGPEEVANNISTHICRLRRKLLSTLFRIRGGRVGRYNHWGLVRKG